MFWPPFIPCLVIGIFLFPGQVRSGEPPKGDETKPPPSKKASTDQYGDPLPDGAIARFGTLRFRQGTQVVEVRFSPDGATVLSIDENRIARVWETTTGKESYSFKLPCELQGCWLLTPDHRMVITWTNGHSIRLWESRTGKLLRELTSPHHKFRSVCLTPDSKTLVAVAIEDASDRAVIRLWDLATGKELRDITPAPPEENERYSHPNYLSFVADGKILTGIGFRKGKIVTHLWDFATGQELSALKEYPRVAQSPYLAPNGKLGVGVVKDGDKQTHLWLVDVATGRKIHDLDPVFKDEIRSIDFSPDNRTLMAAVLAGPIHLWDVATGKKLSLPDTEDIRYIRYAAFSPDSRSVAMGTFKGKLVLGEISSGKLLQQFHGYSLLYGRSSRWLSNPSFAFSNNGKLLAGSGRSNRVQIWNTADGKEMGIVSGGHEGEVRSLAVTQDFKMLVSAATDGTVRLWEIPSGRAVRTFTEASWVQDPDTNGPACVAISRDRKTIAVGSKDGWVHLWKTATGKPALKFQAHEKAISSLSFTPDGTQLITGAYGEVFSWDAVTGKQLFQFAIPNKPDPGDDKVDTGYSEQMLAVSPDGKVLAAAGRWPNMIRLWELATGKLLRRLPNPQPRMFEHRPNHETGRVEILYPPGLPFLAFAPDGKTLAWNQNSGIQLWDLKQGKELRLCGGQGGSVTGIAFSPSEGFLAAASDDGTVRFWDPATATILGEIKAARGGFNSIALSPDGKILITGGGDTTILLWDMKEVVKQWAVKR